MPQWRRRSDLHHGRSTLHEECSSYVWVRLQRKRDVFLCAVRRVCSYHILLFSRRLIDHAYSPFHAVLHCGNLSSDVQVFPRPEPVVVDEEVEPMPRAVSTGLEPTVTFIGIGSILKIFKLIYISDLEIVGFIEIADISSPPVISRHLVLPIAVNKGLFWFIISLFIHLILKYV